MGESKTIRNPELNATTSNEAENYLCEHVHHQYHRYIRGPLAKDFACEMTGILRTLQAQLAQAREQADYHRNLIELQGDEIKRQATELQQAREQLDNANKLIAFINQHRGDVIGYDCYGNEALVAHSWHIEGPYSHILDAIDTITPPPSNPAERDV